MVVDWLEWSEVDVVAKWDAALALLPNSNIYQTYGWGEFKKLSGWTVRRGSIVINGVQEAIAQCLIRELWRSTLILVWVPGGPAGSPEGCRRLGQSLMGKYPGQPFYLRASFLEEEQEEKKRALQAAGWTQVTERVGHPLTYQVDLDLDNDSLRRNLSANWRHNLKRGERRGGIVRPWEMHEALDTVYAVYHETCQSKAIPSAFTLRQFEEMRRALGASFTLAVAIGEDGLSCAMRGFGRIGTRAQELVAGTSLAGRRQYANYVLVWRVLELAKQQGCHIYDLSGADRERVPGVSNFKMGIGGRAVSLLGEWEWTNAKWFRWGVNVAVKYRSGGL